MSKYLYHEKTVNQCLAIKYDGENAHEVLQFIESHMPDFLTRIALVLFDENHVLTKSYILEKYRKESEVKNINSAMPNSIHLKPNQYLIGVLTDGKIKYLRDLKTLSAKEFNNGWRSASFH